MQKRIIVASQPDIAPSPPGHLDLEALAELEITSEHPGHPIEAALLPGFSEGWRAGVPGRQTIRVLFKQAQPVRCIQLDFLESAVSRTQEYLIRISEDNGKSFVDIVRQQWNFNPGSTTESEQHFLDFSAVSTIELNINPDIGNSSAFASLENMRVFEFPPTPF